MNTADAPYFPPGSMLRHVQRQRLVGLTYGFRAIFIGATHPVAFIGTYLHTRELDTPAGRLVDTAVIFEDVAIGTRAEADRSLKITAAKHKKVTGTIGEPAGTWPADTPYTAYDPELMLWTWAILADSSIVMYDTLVRRLTPTQRERLYQDWIRWGELFRMPREIAPATYPDFTRWWDAQMASSERHLTELAKVTAETICFRPPLPPYLQPVRPILELIVKGTTPAPIRDLYGITWRWRDEAEFRALTTAIRTGRIALPVGSRGRVSGIFRHIAEHERRQVTRGHYTIPDTELLRRERAARVG